MKRTRMAWNQPLQEHRTPIDTERLSSDKVFSSLLDGDWTTETSGSLAENIEHKRTQRKHTWRQQLLHQQQSSYFLQTRRVFLQFAQEWLLIMITTVDIMLSTKLMDLTSCWLNLNPRIPVVLVSSWGEFPLTEGSLCLLCPQKHWTDPYMRVMTMTLSWGSWILESKVMTRTSKECAMLITRDSSTASTNYCKSVLKLRGFEETSCHATWIFSSHQTMFRGGQMSWSDSERSCVLLSLPLITWHSVFLS